MRLAAAILLVIGLNFLWRRRMSKRVFGAVQENGGWLIFTGIWAIGFSIYFGDLMLAGCGGAFLVGGIGLWKARTWGWLVCIVGGLLAMIYVLTVVVRDGLGVLPVALALSVVFQIWEVWRLRATVQFMDHVRSLGPYGPGD